jgi:hypothetical protein
VRGLIVQEFVTLAEVMRMELRETKTRSGVVSLDLRPI